MKSHEVPATQRTVNIEHCHFYLDKGMGNFAQGAELVQPGTLRGLNSHGLHTGQTRQHLKSAYYTKNIMPWLTTYLVQNLLCTFILPHVHIITLTLSS